jgi:diketogulonate reductase-like aldo/keto reductase
VGGQGLSVRAVHNSSTTETDDGFSLEAPLRNPKAIVSQGLPFLVYGTAWKKDLTPVYVAQALRAGFRFVDTACQPKHYNEAGVGEGWTSAAKDLGLARRDFFLQTKFTPDKGQDPDKIPYNRSAPIEDQVRQSLAMSLTNLRTSYIDSLVMHSPLPSMEDTMRVWRTMESFVDDGTVRGLGISNCYDYKMFVGLYNSARVKPRVLQNRFYDKTGFDTELRAFCKANGIWYQSFWTLTANRKALASAKVKALALHKHLTPQTLMYAFLMQLGHTPLSGTTSTAHMKEDVAVMEMVQRGELVFDDEADLRYFASLLGMPGL